MSVVSIPGDLSRETQFFVIEDDPDHQKIAEMTLHMAGYNDIRFFDTGEEAIIYFQETNPSGSKAAQVILIDLMLPKICGLEILERLKRDDRWKSSTMVVLTSSNSAEDKKRSRELGANAFLSKPLRPKDLEDILSCVSG